MNEIHNFNNSYNTNDNKHQEESACYYTLEDDEERDIANDDILINKEINHETIKKEEKEFKNFKKKFNILLALIFFIFSLLCFLGLIISCLCLISSYLITDDQTFHIPLPCVIQSRLTCYGDRSIDYKCKYKVLTISDNNKRKIRETIKFELLQPLNSNITCYLQKEENKFVSFTIYSEKKELLKNNSIISISIFGIVIILLILCFISYRVFDKEEKCCNFRFLFKVRNYFKINKLFKSPFKEKNKIIKQFELKEMDTSKTIPLIEAEYYSL